MSNNETTPQHRYCPACFEAYEPAVEICPADQTGLVRLQHPDGPLTGQTLDGKYVVVELLGRGGMGEVYRARQLPMDREVAIKVLYKEFLRTPQDVKRFVREASAASRMKSRYAAMIHDFGIAREGLIYLTMELAEGATLSDHLRGETPLDIVRALHVGIDVCLALEDAHANGIVHRDLKPGNIMLNVEDDHEIARVLDFGTARIVDGRGNDRLTDEGKIYGTPEYMCPEQAMGEDVDASADLYSLGILLYEMLTGTLPFTGKTHTAILLSHINRQAKPIPEVAPDAGIPLPLVLLVEHLMAKKGRDRPASARVVRQELEDILLDLAGEPPPGHKHRYRTVSLPDPVTRRDPLPLPHPTASEIPHPRTLQLPAGEIDDDEDMDQALPTEELEPQGFDDPVLPMGSARIPTSPVEQDIWDPPTGELLEITSLPSFDEAPPEGRAPLGISNLWGRVLLGILGAGVLVTGALLLAKLL